MRKILPFLVLLLIISLYMICLSSHGPQIQASLDEEIKAQLWNSNYKGIGVITDGRDITLQGNVATKDIKKSIGETILGIWGVRKVNNLLFVNMPHMKSGSSPMQGAACETGVDTDIAVVRETQPECLEKVTGLLGAQKIQFTSGSSAIRQSSFDLLTNIAETLKTCEGISIEIAGHTDSQGKDSLNENLSLERASAVRNHLVKNEVEPSSLSAAGYGEYKPIADNTTAEGRAQNRRIEFNVKENN